MSQVSSDSCDFDDDFDDDFEDEEIPEKKKKLFSFKSVKNVLFANSLGRKPAQSNRELLSSKNFLKAPVAAAQK